MGLADGYGSHKAKWGKVHARKSRDKYFKTGQFFVLGSMSKAKERAERSLGSIFGENRMC